MGRDIRNLVKIEDEVRSKGGRIISAAGEGTDSDGTNDIFMRGIFDLVSQHERNMISDRTKAAMQAKKAKGERVGHVPFGFCLSEDGIHIQKDEHEQSILQQIKELMGKGLSTRKIAAEMNTRGAFNRGGAKWNHASIHRAMMKIAA
jgi:DNA invertase Pin-like site-specific DNA recombinase